LEIKKSHEHYHNIGTYYVMLKPRAKGFLQLLTPNDMYEYSIKYAIESSYNYIHNQPAFSRQRSDEGAKIYRYVVENRDQDHKISFNLFKGKAVIKLAFDVDLSKRVSTKDEEHDGRVFAAGTS